MNLKSDDIVKELRELVERGKAGDDSVLPRVRQLLDQHPAFTDYFGDVAKLATELWLSFHAGDNVVLVEATRQKMVSLRASIAGSEPSPLESLFIDRIVIGWLQMHATEAVLAQAHAEKASATIIRERQQQVTASQRTYAMGLKQLAELRKLVRSAPDRRTLHFPVISEDPLVHAAEAHADDTVSSHAPSGQDGLDTEKTEVLP